MVLLALALPAQAQPQARSVIYGELGGNAVFYSLNYDRLLLPNVSGRIGAGFYSSTASAAGSAETERFYSLLVPLTASYLVGGGPHYAELGGGLILGVVTGAAGSGLVESGGPLLDLTGTAGYRYQPPGGGFFFRIAFTPFYTDEIWPWGGLGLGYAF